MPPIKFNVIVPLISSSEMYLLQIQKWYFVVMFYFNKVSDFKITINVQTWNLSLNVFTCRTKQINCICVRCIFVSYFRKCDERYNLWIATSPLFIFLHLMFLFVCLFINCPIPLATATVRLRYPVSACGRVVVTRPWYVVSSVPPRKIIERQHPRLRERICTCKL